VTVVVWHPERALFRVNFTLPSVPVVPSPGLSWTRSAQDYGVVAPGAEAIPSLSPSKL